MSWLIGKTEARPTSSAGTTKLQNDLTSRLGGSGLDMLFPGTQVDPAAMQPYLDLFTQQNARNFAQAKESAGNLTGSGLGNIIGAEAGRANVEQGAFLANLFEQRRQADANRAAGLAGMALNSGAGRVDYNYTPGLLDYIAQGATGLASGGAFNNLFNRNKRPAYGGSTGGPGEY